MQYTTSSTRSTKHGTEGEGRWQAFSCLMSLALSTTCHTSGSYTTYGREGLMRRRLGGSPAFFKTDTLESRSLDSKQNDTKSQQAQYKARPSRPFSTSSTTQTLSRNVTWKRKPLRLDSSTTQLS